MRATRRRDAASIASPVCRGGRQTFLRAPHGGGQRVHSAPTPALLVPGHCPERRMTMASSTKTRRPTATDARFIIREHKAAEASREAYRDHARRCGERLVKVKDSLKHGEWLPWLKENCPELSERTAREYMRFARGEVGDLTRHRTKSAVTADLDAATTGQPSEPEGRNGSRPARDSFEEGVLAPIDAAAAKLRVAAAHTQRFKSTKRRCEAILERSNAIAESVRRLKKYGGVNGKYPGPKLRAVPSSDGDPF
jgi:hypothetical protein